MYDRGARNYRHDWAPISAIGCRNGSETVIVTVVVDNSPTKQNGFKAPCWGQHTQISCFACPYLTTNLVPKNKQHFVRFVSGALNLDPKTYHRWPHGLLYFWPRQNQCMARARRQRAGFRKFFVNFLPAWCTRGARARV